MQWRTVFSIDRKLFRNVLSCLMWDWCPFLSNPLCFSILHSLWISLYLVYHAAISMYKLLVTTIVEPSFFLVMIQITWSSKNWCSLVCSLSDVRLVPYSTWLMGVSSRWDLMHWTVLWNVNMLLGKTFATVFCLGAFLVLIIMQNDLLLVFIDLWVIYVLLVIFIPILIYTLNLILILCLDIFCRLWTLLIHFRVGLLFMKIHHKVLLQILLFYNVSFCSHHNKTRFSLQIICGWHNFTSIYHGVSFLYRPSLLTWVSTKPARTIDSVWSFLFSIITISRTFVINKRLFLQETWLIF